ncbi:MAG: mycofactocin biosynthesis peptidyl-dipeptidase MftE [Nocardioides sp.]|uniref:mycofactocin biosynthesis peptidyl-dipeptidase MftE n=1 Tax=Nocardioides sp. TaxID=35761 RepID=UPI002397F4EF|nr:mycofactocin biosynthesis peptidyl-dipeptidase MftE [Nocardioides sp.]MDE0775433.1 mycofactocin biosynthesis peptidyl-dipeptidase MftE [Nocardioides sp.]
MKLAEATTRSVQGAGLVLVPVGSIEQHGAHLPLDTDTVIATAVATAAADHLGGWVAPALSYGSSGEHQSFAGTSSIGTEVLRLTVVELVRSLSTWTSRVLLVNGHGGNVEALAESVAQLHSEGHDVDWIACRTEASHPGDLHAGRTETSLMLHLAPWSVRLAHARPGTTRPLREILSTMRIGGVAAVSPSGVLGDPTGASADEGARLVRSMVADVVRAASPGTSRTVRR